MGKKILFALAVILSLMYLASAITGSIGSAKMILRAKPGEEIGRSILVRNVNDSSNSNGDSLGNTGR